MSSGPEQVRVWPAAHRTLLLSLIAVALAVVVFVFGVAINLAAATFVLVLYTAVFSAAVVVGWKPLEARPSLEVGLWVQGELVSTLTQPAGEPRRPVDIEACVRNAVSAVRAEIPAPPAATTLDLSRAGIGLGGLGDLAAQFGGETRERAIERLDGELLRYEKELSSWLTGYVNRLWPGHAIIREKVAIHNGGENVADRITLRITLPDGVLPVTLEQLEALPMPDPPTAPRYERRSGWETQGIYDIPDLASLARGFPPVQTIGRRESSGPTIGLDHGRITAEVRLESLTHGVTERSERKLDILPEMPGVYDLAWQAHAGNLRRPAKGTIRIVAGEMPVAGEPLRSIEAVLEAGGVPIKDR